MELVFDLLTSPSSGKSADNVFALRHAVENAPGAPGLLSVTRIYEICHSEQQKISFGQAIQKLQCRAADPSYPKPTWRDEGLTGDPARNAAMQREREEVLWQLFGASEPAEPSGLVKRVRVFHGCGNKAAAQCIASTGLAANIAKTKGWFSEGIYGTLSAPYALRYALGMEDFWEAAQGRTGIIIAATAIFSQVYPVTRAVDYTRDPQMCDLKGQRLKRGCDAHFVCVRRTPPSGDEARWTYHSCFEGQRPHATELVIQQEEHILPEYAIEVELVQGNEAADLRAQARLAALHWAQPAAAAADAPAALPTVQTEGGAVGTPGAPGAERSAGPVHSDAGEAGAPPHADAEQPGGAPSDTASPHLEQVPPREEEPPPAEAPSEEVAANATVRTTGPGPATANLQNEYQARFRGSPQIRYERDGEQNFRAVLTHEGREVSGPSALGKQRARDAVLSQVLAAD